jgi:hypothetical protein
MLGKIFHYVAIEEHYACITEHPRSPPVRRKLLVCDDSPCIAMLQAICRAAPREGNRSRVSLRDGDAMAPP